MKSVHDFNGLSLVLAAVQLLLVLDIAAAHSLPTSCARPLRCSGLKPDPVATSASPCHLYWRDRATTEEACTSAHNIGVLRLTGGADRDARAPFLLCTDLDDTLVGDAKALEEFNDLWRNVLAPRGCKLVYNTGRSMVDYKALRRDWDLLIPDAFIGGCGTQVYTFDSEGSEGAVSAWVESLQSGWDKTNVASRILSDPGLQKKYGEIQEKTESKDNELLFSMRLPPATSDVDAVKRDMLAALECSPEEIRINVASVSFKGQTTVTGAADADVSGSDGCLFVDVMPKAAGKGLALRYVRQQLLDMDAARCIVAGDSGNDVAMFESDVERGIMVGNAKRELLDVRKPSHFVAERRYAAGLIQGLSHYGEIPVQGD